ncbi:MAG: CPBP family intramembrane metalloprotease [Coriobacteriia bacterium]|nr:CPBP family intramembrane metalloprotease [Coriobacteriia bacterium]
MTNYIAYNDKDQIRRDVRSVVLGVAAFILTMSLVSAVVLAVAVVFENMGELMQVVEEMDGPMSFESSSQLADFSIESIGDYIGLASILGMLCGLPWLFLVRGKKFLTSDVTRVHSKVNIPTISFLFILILGVQFLMVLIQTGVEPLFEQTGGSFTEALEESTASLVSWPWGVLYVVILGPIFEELVFRGAVMRRLERHGANFAIIVSSVLFGLYHMILFQAIFAFFIGLILAYAAGRFSLKWAILLHMLNNGLAVLQVHFALDETFALVVLICYFVAFIITLAVLIAKKRLITAQRRAGAPLNPRVYAYAFSSPWIIAYLFITTLVAVQLLFI